MHIVSTAFSHQVWQLHIHALQCVVALRLLPILSLRLLPIFSLKPLPVLFLSYFVLFCPSCSVNSTCLMQLYLTVLSQAVFHLSFPGFQTLNLFLLLAPFFYSLEHVIREPLPLTSNKLLKTSSTAILQSSSIKKFNLYFCWNIYLS